MSRSLLLFESAIKTEATKKQYTFYLKQFLTYAKLDDPDALLTLKDSALQVMLEDYLFHIKKRISPNSIPPIYAALELFLSMNDKTLNFTKVRKMFPSTLKKSGSGAWTTDNIGKMLEVAGSKRNKALILLMSSTGCRVGAIPELKIKHIKDYENCKQITFYPGSKEEYVGFLTPESSKMLDDYLAERRKDGEKITDDSPVFRSVYKIGSMRIETMGIGAVMALMKRIVESINVTRESNGKRYGVQLNHGFRKRYNTILKVISDVNPNIAEKLLGHKNGLDGVYFVPTVEQLFTEFRKSISELTIDNSERLSVRLEQSEKAREQKNKELESQNELKSEVAELRKELSETKEKQAQQAFSNALMIKNSSLIESIKEEIIGKLKEDALKQNVEKYRKEKDEKER